MNRSDFQQLAELRNEEAAILLASGKPSGAYYLVGYAVECALKACVAKLTQQFDFPDRVLANKCYTHDIDKLFQCANLDALRDAQVAANPAFAKNMLLLEEWSEGTRYEVKTTVQAQELFNAINDPQDGVLIWLKSHW